MKFKRIIAFAALSLAVFGLSACTSNNKSADNEKIPTKVTKTTKIVFWHSLIGHSKSTLIKLTNEFEKENPNIKIKLESQGGNYSDLQAKLTSTMQSPKNLPTISTSYPGWLYSAAKNKMLVNLTPYIDNKDLGWGSLEQSNIKPSLWDGAKINGVQYGVPFNKSVEVLFYNKDLLDKYNVKVPTNMNEMKKAAQTIYEKSNHKVVGAGFDSLNNYYMLAMKDKGINFTKNINFEGKESKQVINYYANGVKAGYFQTAGTQKYLSYPFTAQKLAMFVGSCANDSYIKSGMNKKFTYDVAPRPSEYNIQQGTDIYMFNNATAMQKAAAFKFIKFLVSKQSQITWGKLTGYFPVNDQALVSKAYTNSESKVPAQLSKTSKNLYFVPITKNATPAYDQIKANMQTILALANKGASWDGAIKQGNKKLNAAWNQ